jgi:hypothetical protein
VVVVGAAVVAGVAVSELPPHPETTSKNANATVYFLIATACHPTPQGGGGDIGAPGVDTRRRILGDCVPGGFDCGCSYGVVFKQIGPRHDEASCSCIGPRIRFA